MTPRGADILGTWRRHPPDRAGLSSRLRDSEWTHSDRRRRARSELRAAIAQAVVPAWTRFYERYREVRFSKKHATEYLRYAPAVVRRVIDEELFSG